MLAMTTARRDAYQGRPVNGRLSLKGRSPDSETQQYSLPAQTPSRDKSQWHPSDR